MCNRRNKPIYQAAVLLALIGGLGYTFYLYNMTTMDLEIARSEADKYLKQQGSLSSQLQVVYEHRARLERSLQKEKTEHKNTKLDFSKKQNDFLLNVTRSKHEAMNRFNSLETQYNMLKAQAKELDTDYNRLRQQYARLSSEHTTLNNQQKRNFQLYKEQKANEIASLDEEINTLKRQVVSLRTQVKSKTEEAEQYQLSSSRAMSANQKYQETLKTLQEELASYKEKLKNAVRQPRTDESARDEKHDLDRRGEARKKDGNFLVDSKKERIIEKEKVERRQEKESPATPSRSDSRENQERYRRQTHVQVTLPSDNDADQADMRRPPDGNVNERKQDVNDESQTRGEILSRSSDRSKSNENAQDDGYSRRENIPLRNSDQDTRVADKGKSDLYPRRDNIPLRDSNQDTRLADKEPGVKVVSPTENAMNKWADILKAARQGHKDEGEEREEANKEINEESREERKRLDGDDKQHGGNKQSDLYQRQRGEEEIKEEHIGKPVADRPDVHGDQAQEHREHRNQDNQGIGFNDRGDEEEHQDDEADGLSRQNINKKMAEMEETYQQKQINQQQQGGQLQGQDNARRPAGYNQIVPISAVQRQETVQQQRAQPAADADNDDEDAADDDQNDQDEDPDEEDPDDAGEEDGDNLEDSPQQQQQQQQVHQAQQQDANKHDRSLKAADNNKQNEQETKLT